MKGNTRKATQRNLQRSAIALAVASAFGLGTNAAFAVPPTITAYTPADNATSASTTAVLRLTFDQNVTAVTGKNIIIRKTTDDSIVETIAVDNISRMSVGGSIVSISHSASLALASDYYVQIDSGAFQNAGAENFAGIADATTWNFTTPANASITSYSPTNGATDFLENANLALTFSESMTAVAGKNLTIYKTSDNSVVETIAATDTTKVSASSFSGSFIFTINPSANLPAGSYYVQIDAGAFTGNTSGASYAGIADTTTWAFTSVADTVAPTATISTPADNATGVAPSSNLIFYFNEKVTAVTGKTIKVYKSDNTLVETIAADDATKVSLSSSKGSTSVTINPTNDLAFNTGYYVQIDSGAFVDTATAPNAYTGIADTTTWNFTTAAGATVTYFHGNGTTNFIETSDLQFNFSEAVTPIAGKAIVIKRTSDNSVVETIAANDIYSMTNQAGKISISPTAPNGEVTVYINPAANLTAGSYTLHRHNLNILKGLELQGH